MKEITGEQIRKAREARGWSRSGFAWKIGVHPTSLAFAERTNTANEARDKAIKALGLADETESADKAAETADAHVISGQSIRNAREGRGWSRKYVADRCGVSEQTVLNIENDVSKRSLARDRVIRTLGLAEAIDRNGTVREAKVIDESSALKAADFIGKTEGTNSTPMPVEAGSGKDFLDDVSDDLVIPVALARVARTERLKVSQCEALMEIEAIIARTNGMKPGGVTEGGWRGLWGALKGEWL